MKVTPEPKPPVSPVVSAPAPAGGVTGLEQPLVLLATAYRWPSSARIAISFAEAGWSVEAVCPRGHLLGYTRAVRRLHRCHSLAIAQSLRRAIFKAKPDLVIPCDDLVAGHLRRLGVSDSSSGTSDELRVLLARSLGEPSCYEDLASRSRTAAIVRRQGVAVPETDVARSVAEVESWVARNGLPCVLKVDGSSGGYGVRIVSTLDEARSAFAALSVPISFLRAVKRAVVDKNETFLIPSLRHVPPVVNLQRYVVGTEVTCTSACWQGEILACVMLRVVKTSGQVGTSTVVQIIDNPGILSAIELIVRSLRISGLCGFDFIVEQKTGQIFLIEINPRATQTTHLGTAAGSLALALRGALTGKRTQPGPGYKNGDTIALFPQEWLRDPESDLLRAAAHDIPWNEPEFVRACLCRETTGMSRLLRPDGRLARLFSKSTA